MNPYCSDQPVVADAYADQDALVHRVLSRANEQRGEALSTDDVIDLVMSETDAIGYMVQESLDRLVAAGKVRIYPTYGALNDGR